MQERPVFEGQSPEFFSELEEQLEWMTIGKIAKYIGKSYDWVQKRALLRQDEAEHRADSQGRVRLYFPPSFIAELKEEALSLDTYPVVTERDISLNGISRLLNREEGWIAARLPFLNIQPTDKLNPTNNRVFPYYDRETDLPPLEAENKRMRQYPVADNSDITVEGIARRLEKDRKWVRRRLEYIDILPVVKMNDANHQLDMFYSADQILPLILAVEIAPEPEQLKAGRLRSAHPVVQLPSSRTGGPDTYNWMDFSECAQTDPDLFTDIKSPEQARQARKICGQCGVRLFCLDYAIVNNEQDGVWGGLTIGERKKLKLVS